MTLSNRRTLEVLTRALRALQGQGHGVIFGSPDYKPGCPLCSAAELVNAAIYYVSNPEPGEALRDDMRNIEALLADERTGAVGRQAALNIARAFLASRPAESADGLRTMTYPEIKAALVAHGRTDEGLILCLRDIYEAEASKE